MKKIHFSATLAVAAIAMCFSVLAHAQNKLSDASISGHIIDSKTGEHLPYVMVMVGAAHKSASRLHHPDIMPSETCLLASTI